MLLKGISLRVYPFFSLNTTIYNMAKKTKLGIKVPTQNEILKKYGSIIIDPEKTPTLWLPSRFLALNHQYGGGIPYGKILEVMGEESSGKSLVAYDFAYCTQQLGGHVIWVDAEQAFTKSWAETNGIDLANITVISDTRIEEISDAIAELGIFWRSKLTHNEPILLVVDSVAAMDCEENINAKMSEGKAEMGGRAKALYKMLRIRSELFSKIGVSQLYVNQLRTALNVGFGKDNSTTTGGAGLKFYASIRSAFYAGRSISKKVKGIERKVGKCVTIRMIKNKVSPPRETLSKVPVYFHYKYCEEVGFDRYFGFGDVLIETEVIEKTSGGVYKYRGKTIARGEESFQKVMVDNDELRKKLIRRSGVNTISLTRDKMESLPNQYPLDDSISFEPQSESDEEETE